MHSITLRSQVAVFSVLFASGMWMSKVAQPLHYQSAGALVAFGIGYAVMACVGGLSFAWGALADRMGGLNAVRLGTVLYAIGIAGRIFTDLVPTIAASTLAGAGASIALVGLRPWIRSSTGADAIPRVVAARGFGNQVGMFMGTLGAAGLFLLSDNTDTGSRAALLLAAALAFGAFLWVCILRPSGASDSVVHIEESTPAAGDMRSIAAKLAIVGLLSGFYVSLITPYLPLYLTNAGLSSAASAVVIAAMTVAQLAVTGILARRGGIRRPMVLFLITEAGTAAATFGVAFALGLPAIVVILVFVARAAFVAIAVTAEETIQYAIIPGNAAGFVFGISQTAFLVGDALGGAVAGPLWNAFGPMPLAMIAAGATLINAFALPILFRSRRSALRAATVDVAA